MRFGRGAGMLWLAAMVGVLGWGQVRAWGQVRGGMLDPEMDTAGEPFSYFWHPTDVIGTLFAPVATEVTPEGYLYTGFGELMFFVGNPPRPVQVRIKTLYEGYLPMVQYHVSERGLEYRFRMFAADLGEGLAGLPVNFVEVEVENPSGEERTGFLSSGFRFSAPVNGLGGGRGDYRFQQRFDLMPKEYVRGQTEFNRHWKYAWGRKDTLLREGRILYMHPGNPEPEQRTMALRDNGLRMYRFFTGEEEGEADPSYEADLHAPLGVVMYRVRLRVGEKRSLVFKLPIVPLPEGSAEAKQVEEAGYEANFRKTVEGWKELVGKRPPLSFPEAKVQEALLANTVFDLLAIDKIGDDYIPNVNKFQYHAFYGGSDTNHMLVGLDYTGQANVARKAALYSVKAQSPEGAFISRDDTPTRVYWEMFGNTMWMWGRHYLLTRDDAFLHEIYPSVLRAMEWERSVTRQDPLHLMPVFSVADDAALKDAHQTGQDLWALAGIRNVVAMAKAMGRSEDVARFEAEYQRLREAFDKALAIQTAKTGGYIPPALDRTVEGNNWDNLLTLYPEPLFPPFDPRVTATIRESRRTYAEGILGYVLPIALAASDHHFIYDSTRLLHYWHSLDNAQSGLVRGDPEGQEFAVRDLYALLLHTTSTHAPQEFGTQPWSTRDLVSGDILPDGATSGVLVELMRNMLVREYQNDLFLFSALSPAWLEPGKSVEVRDESTVFGPISAVLRVDNRGGWEVKLSNQFRQAPNHVVISIPWFYEVEHVEADGRAIQPKNGKLALAPATREVRVTGRVKPGTPRLSFEETVEEYKREYRKRYEEFLRTGDVGP